MNRPASDGIPHPEWRFHVSFLPPLLRSSTVRKFFAGYELFAVKRGPESPPLTQAIGYLTIFVWVTAAAAGRWIAFA